MKKNYICILILFLSFNALAMQIFIVTPSNGTIALEVEANDPIENIRDKIQEKIGISPNDQVLKYNGQILENERTLADYNIQKESTIQLTLSTLGVSSVALNNSKFHLYPNPSYGFIFISNFKKIKKYSILNTLGQEVFKGPISDNGKIDTKNLINGLYFLKLENGKTIKFIKE